MIRSNIVAISGFLIWVFIWTITASAQGKDILRLESIPKIGPPKITKNHMRITVNFIFNRIPSDYWVHYNKAEKRLIFEFIGMHLEDTHLELTGTDILSGLKIENSESQFAVNKKISRLTMLLDEGWHYESWTIGTKIIRLHIFKPLNPEKNLKKENKVPLPLILAIVICTAASAFGIAAWIQSAMD